MHYRLFCQLMLLVSFSNGLLSGKGTISSTSFSTDREQWHHQMAHHYHHHYHSRKTGEETAGAENGNSETDCCQCHGESPPTVLPDSLACFRNEAIPNRTRSLCFWETHFLNEPFFTQPLPIKNQYSYLSSPPDNPSRLAIGRSIVQLI